VKISIKKILAIFIIALVFINAKAQNNVAQYSSDVATKWLDLQLKMIPETPGFSPPVVSRALGYSSLTLYESLVNGMPKYKSLVGIAQDLNKLPLPDNTQEYNWLIVANTAQALICKSLYATNHKPNEKIIEALRDNLYSEYKSGVAEKTISRSLKYGEELAKAIIKYSKTDGTDNPEKNNFPKNYQNSTGSCNWIPVGDQKALQPYWGKNRTFIKGNADFDLPVPPKCELGNTSLLYVQALEVYSIGINLTDEQKAIAMFWSDDAGKTFTPPGHGMAIANGLIIKEKLNLEKSAELICRLGIAAHDAFISCWKCKYQHNILRPTSFIHTAIDPDWKAFLDTPPFPEYTSGHGTVSGAMAIVLSDMFGYNYAFTDNSHIGRGLRPRNYDSFLEAAQEAAVSRLYGGIHYRMSNDEGMKNGKRIGKAVCELKLKMKAS
jgi:hypothetical protein